MTSLIRIIGGFFANNKIDHFCQVFRETVIEGLDTSMFELDQVFFESKDGTKVPMFIASRYLSYQSTIVH